MAHALPERGLKPSLVLTGQHSRLDPADFGLDRYPAQQLSCPGEEDPHCHVERVCAALQPTLDRGPALLVVQGDTSSAMGGALAGAAAAVPVAHVEAGLRTHDPLLPWPEEEYRVAIDGVADLLFAPTAVAAANLFAERVSGEVHVTGNTSIDAVLALEAALPPPGPRRGSLPRLLVTAHRRESWGDGLRSIAAALRELANEAVIEFVLHPNAHVAATMRAELRGIETIHLIPPCSQVELVRRMRDCDLLLSDSGGIQEEAPALGVPLLVLRDKTERPEGLACGSALLVGTSHERIVTEARRVLRDGTLGMRGRAFPYGDGKAGPRIAAIIDDWLRRADGVASARANDRGLPHSQSR